MERKKIIDEVQSKYLGEYKFIYKKEDRISFFKNLIAIAETNSILEYFYTFSGYVEQINENYDSAIDLFQQAIMINNEFSYPWNGLGNVYNDQKEYDKAVPAYNKALDLDNKFPYPWTGLGNVYRAQKEYDKAIDAYNKAILLDDKYPSPWNGLGNVYGAQKKYDKAINAFNKEIQIDNKNPYPSNGLGNVYLAQKEYDKAIDAYNKAILLDDKYPSPWNGLGNLYLDLKDYDKAIDTYNKAILLDDKNPSPWNGLGNLYRAQKEYDKAIDAYNKAILLDDKYLPPWNGLGNVYLNKNEWDKAIEYYKLSLLRNGDRSSPTYNLGLVYKIKNELNIAKQYFESAKNEFIKENNKYWLSITKSNLNEIEIRIKAEEALKEVDYRTTKDPISEILVRTAEFEQQIFEKQKSFLTFFDQDSENKGKTVFLKVLRRWNSYTPIIADNFHISKGGGYFIKVNGVGIVIDPGFNFIDNFKGAGHKFDEIDAVIISHAHNDHTSDLESIITLLNNCNNKRKGLNDFTSEDTMRAEIAKDRECELSIIKEEEIEKEFRNSPKRKKINIYLTKSTSTKFSGMLRPHSKHDYECHPIETGDTKTIVDKNGKKVLQFKVIQAKHDDVISDRDSVGFVLELNEKVFVYSGDTGWSEKISNQYQEIKKNCGNKKVILLAHIGGFKDYENNYLLPDKKEKLFYTNHLGRLGLAKLCQILEPEICFISEFGEEIRNYRDDIAKIFTAAFEDKIVFLPADIGMEYDFVSDKIKAITSIDVDNSTYLEDYIEANQVAVCLLRKDFSLHYFDKSKNISESDLIQILIDKYDRSIK